MPYRDLRQFIERLHEAGEIQRIDAEVDWNLELGAVCRRSYDLRAPAPFFQQVSSYPQGYRVLGAPLGLSRRAEQRYARLALALDLPVDSSIEAIVEEYIRRRGNLIPPVLTNEGPCQEEVHLGKDVDLTEFPAPLLHEGDGGRYVGTWHTVITRDPDTGWVNWGMYRLMVHDSTSMGILVAPNQHIGLHYYQKYEARNRPMPFAVAIGTEPVTAIMSSARTQPGVDESAIVGGLRGEPVELVKCLTVDLAVPATSEIVIEGEILPHERHDEGPFGEYPGYRVSGRSPKPICRVTAVTHRRNPILPVSCVGAPVEDSHVVQQLTKTAEILDDLRSRGYSVTKVYCPAEAVTHLVVVSIKNLFPHYARNVAHAVWGGSGWGRSAWYLVVVEDDIDVTNMDQVLWALFTRCHPDRGIYKVPQAPGMSLLPFLNPYERENNLGAYVMFDCTWPKDWPEDAVPSRVTFDNAWPAEIQHLVLSRWSQYGYREG